MQFQRRYFLEYISIISYVLKSCFNGTKAQSILNTILNDFRTEILYGSPISFKCVPDIIAESILTQCYDNKTILKNCLQVDKCLFISQEVLTKLKLDNFQWVLVNIMIEDSCRIPMSHYNRVVVLNNYDKVNCLLTLTNLYNLGSCNNTHQILMLRIIKPLIHFKPNIAKKVSISVIKPFLIAEDMQIVLDKALYNYFSCSKLASVGNIFKLDLNKFYSGAEYLIKPLSSIFYFKVVELEVTDVQTHFYNCKNSFYISSLHSKLNEVHYLTNIYLPIEKEFAVSNLEYLNINNFKDFIINVFPDGINHNAELLVSWIKPFMQHKYKLEFNTLKPIFLVYGCSESGKELLIISVSKYLGLKYLSQCCFEWTANNINLLKKKIENFFDGVRKMNPCLLHLENFEALSLFSSDHLKQELVDVFTKQIHNIMTTEPIVIIASTSSKEELSPVFLRLFLQCLEIQKLNKNDGEKLLKWILKKESMKSDNTLVKTVMNHTSGYNYKNYLELLLLSTKHHMCTHNKSTEIVVNKSDLMISIDTMNLMVSKSIGTPKIQTVKWDDVGGLIDVKDEIIAALKTSTMNIRRSGILLYGPPGTGKTLLAKAVATEYMYNFLSIKGPELLNMYIGQSEANVRNVFDKARSAAPCILFFDELDSLAPKRGQNGDSGGVGDRVVSQLLTEMDGVRSENHQIFVLGATNRLDLIDSAVLRPGRLDVSIYVGACSSKNSKLQILKSLTKKFKLDSNLFLEDLIDHLPQEVTGAELYGVCHNAWLNSARRVIQQNIVNNDGTTCANNITVTKEDFMAALY